jgi:hypothetical protein
VHIKWNGRAYVYVCARARVYRSGSRYGVGGGGGGGGGGEHLKDAVHESGWSNLRGRLRGGGKSCRGWGSRSKLRAATENTGTWGQLRGGGKTCRGWGSQDTATALGWGPMILRKGFPLWSRLVD